jgi:hypothetical protein
VPLARDIPPQPILINVYQVPDATRTSATNESVEAFIKACYEGLAAIEDYRQRIASNAALSPRQARERALRVIREIDKENDGDYLWLNDVKWRSGLKHSQAFDAIEFWNRSGALRSNEEPVRYGRNDAAWMFRMTPHGRDLADGEAPSHEIVTGSTINFNVHNNAPGNIQQIGSANVANMLQTTTVSNVLSNTITTIRAQLSEFPETEREEVQEHLAIIEEEATKESPRSSRIKSALAAIGRISKEAGKAALSAVVEGAVSAAISSMGGG